MDFYRRMELVCRRIPAGTAATYGQIALLCGKPRNARQVGRALRMNLAGENIPAHRIVSADGYLRGAGYFETWDLQKLLLEEEGVAVEHTDKGWRVDLGRYGWKNTMEDAYQLQTLFEENGI